MVCFLQFFFAMQFNLTLNVFVGGCMRTPGQDYCGLSLVSPVSNPVSSKKTSNYATIELSEYIVLHVVISLVNYLMCPRYQSVLSRVLLPLLPCFLTNSSDCMFKMSTGGILTLFGEVHRMLLLVDGRYAIDEYVNNRVFR